jgi:hypothetical protein
MRLLDRRYLQQQDFSITGGQLRLGIPNETKGSAPTAFPSLSIVVRTRSPNSNQTLAMRRV